MFRRDRFNEDGRFDYVKSAKTKLSQWKRGIRKLVYELSRTQRLSIIKKKSDFRECAGYLKVLEKSSARNCLSSLLFSSFYLSPSFPLFLPPSLSLYFSLSQIDATVSLSPTSNLYRAVVNHLMEFV